MDDNTKKHPSLPSNYVTIAHLQERWLKQKQQQQQQEQQKIENNDNNQQKQQDEEKQQSPTQSLKQHQQHPRKRGEPAVVVRTVPNRRAVMYRPKIRTDSVTNSSAIEAKAGIGDENADRENKGNESKWKWKRKRKSEKKVKRNPRVEEKVEKGTSEGALAEVKTEGSKEEEESSDAKKATIEIEIESNEKTSDDSKVEELVEQKFGGLSKNSRNGRFKEVNEGTRRSQSHKSNHGGRGGGFRRHKEKRRVEERRTNEGALAEVKMDGNKEEAERSDAKRATIESESNEKKNMKSDDSTVEEVENKFGGLSMSSASGKQNGWFKRGNEGSRYPQFQSSYGYGDFGGGSHRRRSNYEDRNRRIEKSVWVRKNGNVGGEIETWLS